MCVCVCVCVCVAKPVAVELRCHATALIKLWDTLKLCYNYPMIQIRKQYQRFMCPNDADEMVNSAGPDHTALLGAI